MIETLVEKSVVMEKYELYQYQEQFGILGLSRFRRMEQNQSLLQPKFIFN